MPPAKSAPKSKPAAKPAAAKPAAAKAERTSLPLTHARARWHLRQGLAAPGSGPLSDIVGATSWPRTLGGIDVYLAVRARAAGMSRADFDATIERGSLQVIPAVRGCIYVVPRALAPLCLAVAEDQWRPRTDREIQKAGTTWTEIDEVAAASRAALHRGPLTTDALRRALPAGTVRSLGDAGKKIGISSPLPLALRVLEFAGHIERTLPGGRMDTERYEWRLAAPRPKSAATAVPATAAARHARLAEIFFAGASPATVKDFAEWAGLAQRDAREAIAGLPLQPVSVPGYADEAFAFAADLPPAPPSTQVSFLPFDDNYLTYHGGPALLSDPVHHSRPMPVWGNTRGSTLGDAKHVSLRTILCGPDIIGFWEYDPDARRVVHALLPTTSKRAAPAIRTAAEALTAFLRDELQHGRSFNLDTDDELRRRTTMVQQVGA